MLPTMNMQKMVPKTGREGLIMFMQSDNKVVVAYAQPGQKTCVVKLLDVYFSKLPADTDSFYLRPCMAIPKDPSRPWYVKQNIGINKIRDKLLSMSIPSNLIHKSQFKGNSNNKDV